MSLTSVELNYLIWRYLQESGFDLAAYALSKDSACLEYEHATNKLIPLIEPGSLVNLVQKGILYTFLEDSAKGRESQLNLLDAILKDKADFEAAQDSEWMRASDTKKESATSDNNLKETPDEEMQDSGDILQKRDASNEATENEESGPDIAFQTDILQPFVTFASSLSSDWHPSTDVLAFGNEDSTAVIHALGSEGIVESVTLSHPPTIIDGVPVPSTISLVSWSPQGSLMLTAGVDGEIRAWAPDGRLKNIVNSVSLSEPVPAAISSLVWNAPGSLVLSIDIHSAVRLWEGTSLALISGISGVEDSLMLESHACWLSDSKFAISTRQNSIKIFSVNTALPYGENLLAVGQLTGHENAISDICFNPVSKLLASASDEDYAIKVWNSSSSQDALELNSVSEKVAGIQYHTSPILALRWLSRPGDVQGNELVSVSMEGSVNIWDAFTGDPIVSANIFNNPDNFRFSADNENVNISMKHSLVFAAAVSPNSKFLATGDDSGNVSIWDIDGARYSCTSEFLRCLGIFAIAENHENIQMAELGICDIVWDSKSSLITVCYKGRESVIIKWGKTER